MADTPVLMGLGQNHYGTIEVPIGDLAIGTSPPVAGNTDLFRMYTFAAINDDSAFEILVPRDWLPGTNLSMQVYWACNETFALGSGEVRWQMITEPIAWAGTEVVGAGTATTVSGTDTNIPTLARQLTTTTLTIDGTLVAVGELVRVRLLRIALAGGADPVADPEVYRVVIHYTRKFPMFAI